MFRSDYAPYCVVEEADGGKLLAASEVVRMELILKFSSQDYNCIFQRTIVDVDTRYQCLPFEAVACLRTMLITVQGTF